jgi:uncharacterized phiE125 gp8 family phage protein
MFSVVTPSSNESISLQEARSFLLQDPDITDQDMMIQLMVASATTQIEAATGRSVINATFRQSYKNFVDMEQFYMSPVSSISSVKYFDAQGIEQVLSSDVYELVKDEPASIRLKKDQSWPLVDGRDDGIRVEYIAGYGENHEDVPPVVKLPILVVAAWLFENRQGQEFPISTLRALCSSFVVPRARPLYAV